VAPQAVSFLVSIAIARTVGPEAYGLVGALTVFMALGTAFTDMGLTAALVQKKSVSADDQTSVFIVNIAAGTLLTLLFCAVSPLVARFFRHGELAAILCVQSLTFFISSFGLIQQALLTRAMQFRAGAAIETISALTSGAAGIAMAWSGCGVWSLVGLNLSGCLFTVVLRWVFLKWRPTGRFRMESLRSMWGFSSRLLCVAFVNRTVGNAYSILVGRWYPVAALGLYTRAAAFPALPANLLAGIVQRVSFPLFCRSQDDRPALLESIRGSGRMVALIGSAILAWLAALSGELIIFLLGRDWAGAVPLVRILCLSGVLAALVPLHTQMVQATGRSGVFLRLELLKKAFVIAALAVACRFGIEAFAWAAVAVSVSDYVVSAWPSARYLGYSWRRQAADILPPVLLSAAAGAAAWLPAWPHLDSALAIMALRSLVMALVLTLGILAFRKSLFRDVWSRGLNLSDRLVALRSFR